MPGLKKRYFSGDKEWEMLRCFELGKSGDFGRFGQMWLKIRVPVSVSANKPHGYIVTCNNVRVLHVRQMQLGRYKKWTT